MTGESRTKTKNKAEPILRTDNAVIWGLKDIHGRISMAKAVDNPSGFYQYRAIFMRLLNF
jgi:hypothetical protein